MILADYSELVAEATERSGVSDVANRAGMLVGMAEKMLSKRLRLSSMETVIRLRTDAGGRAELPGDFSEMSFVRVGDATLARKPMVALLEGGAHGYATQGKLLRSSHKAAEHVCSYFAALPSLEKNGSNWLLEEEPEIYVHAVLFQIYTASDQIEKASLTAGYLASLIDEANGADYMKRRAGAIVSLGRIAP